MIRGVNMTLKEQMFADRHIFFDDLSDIHTINGVQLSVIMEQETTYFAEIENFPNRPLKDDPQKIDGKDYIVDSVKMDNGILRVDLKQMDLDYTVTFQNATITNVKGSTTKTWTDYQTALASIRQLTADEKANSSQIFAEADYVVECWYFEGITHDTRIKMGAKYFDIVGANNIRDKWLKLRCKELI